VQELLTAKKPLLEELAQRLLEREVLEGEELRRIIAAASETTRVEKALVSQH
jgi:ATP-dependent Zn protease